MFSFGFKLTIVLNVIFIAVVSSALTGDNGGGKGLQKVRPRRLLLLRQQQQQQQNISTNSVAAQILPDFIKTTTATVTDATAASWTGTTTQEWIEETTTVTESDAMEPEASDDTPIVYQPLGRRRNGRKRKRRPVIVPEPTPTVWRGAVDDDTNAYHEERDGVHLDFEKPAPVPRPRIREPFAVLEHEQQLSEQRTKKRRTNDQRIVSDKSFRVPYSVAKSSSEQAAAMVAGGTSGQSAIELKSILKQSGGLSLSEILQQRNLSLADLLRGKQTAIAALANPLLEDSSTSNSEERTKPYRRLPAKISQSQSIRPLNDDAEEGAAAPSLVRIIPTIPGADVVANKRPSLTDKRPMRPIKEVVSGIRPDLTNANTKNEDAYVSSKNRPVTIAPAFIPASSTTPRPPPRWRPFVGIRSSTTTAPEVTTTLVQERVEIDREASVLVGGDVVHTTVQPIKLPAPRTRLPTIKYPKQEETLENRPNRIDHDRQNVASLHELFNIGLDDEEEDPQSFTARIDNLFNGGDLVNLFVDVTESNPSLFADITAERVGDDRTDLLELMEDRRSGARLAKVLAQRNMTLDELVDLRERGSSQVHLAEIFFNRTRARSRSSSRPTTSDEALVADIVTAFDNFPKFQNLDTVRSVKPDEIKTDSQGASYFTSIIDIKPTDGMNTETKKALPPAAPHRPMPELEHIEMDDIENEIARANDLLDLELTGHSFQRSIIPSSALDMNGAPGSIGVRSAIIASTCIVAVSVFIFVVIFVVCRLRQKRRTKLRYTESFTAVTAKGRLPILHRNASKRSTSPMAFSRSGPSRISKLNTMDPNSPEVQDYLFDTMRKEQYH